MDLSISVTTPTRYTSQLPCTSPFTGMPHKATSTATSPLEQIHYSRLSTTIATPTSTTNNPATLPTPNISMLHFLHFFASPFIIRKSNPCVVLSYQHNGWLTKTSWAAVLEGHSEECPRSTSSSPAASSRGFGFLGALSVTVARYITAGGGTNANLLVAASEDDE
jgi:hypothetical protein